MHISQHSREDSVELRLTGRLDATWAEHVGDSIETAVREGSHHIVLNFAGVNYISSLGIGVLMKHYQRLKAVNGSLGICDPSTATLRVLNAAGLAAFLIAAETAAPVAPAAARVIERPEAAYHAYPQPVTRALRCMAIGDPGKLAGGGFAADNARLLTFGAGTFGLGIGAFGEGFDDCRDRFGEFLAAGGCAVTLPTNDLHALPDYVVEEGVLVPHVETLYALTGSGDFPWMVRFDASPRRGTVALSALLDAAFALAESDTVAFVVLAEAAGLVGATLRQSPAARSASLEFPAVRDWVSFTTERTSERSLALLVGVAARNPSPDAIAFLRPIGTGSTVYAHVHAAVFPYRPVQRGELPFGKTIAQVVATTPPATVLHLMADSRPFDGVGETDLVRGACWLGALPGISRG
jgi:anti-anti-sigma factor